MPPFPLPEHIEPSLRPAHDYWRSLRRAGNEMPFWDDLRLSAVEEMKGRLCLLDVLEQPLRFRFSQAGSEIVKLYEGDLVGRFTDEIGARPPLDYFGSQCGATIESRAPTYYAHGNGRRPAGAQYYARLLLPLWGEGAVRMLLGAVAFGGSESTRRLE